MTSGVSVILCCHNSAERLEPTLTHLAAQQATAETRWEVIVVDNASTDQTGAVAAAAWPASAPAPLRVVSEPQAGISHARRRGFAEARYDIVSFIDDDNWVCPGWVQLVAELMAEYPEMGACGGLNEAVCEVEAPWWFERFKKSYVIGPQAAREGFLTARWSSLWGAGMSIRVAAWNQLCDSGWRHLIGGRVGANLAGCEDLELSYALLLTGWRLWYEPRLRLQHFLPERRLQWPYLRRLHHGGGASSVGLDPYGFALSGGSETPREQLRRTWLWQTAATVKALLPYRSKLRRSARCPMEGDPDVLEIEHHRGRLQALIQQRKDYQDSVRELQNAPWRRSARANAATLVAER